jgi:shikimate kinase
MTTNNIRFTLIGMSGVGKSSIGRQLAKHYGVQFVDTDTLIQTAIGKSIHDYIFEHGELRFLELEEKIVSNMSFSGDIVVATGGSVVYSDSSMQHLKSETSVFWLKDSIENIKSRIQSIETRGIVSPSSKVFEDIFNERVSLYEKYADIVVELEQPLNIDQSVRSIAGLLGV